MIPYGRQDITEGDIAAVTAVLRSDWLTTGPAVERFEQDLQAVTGDTPCVAVSSGTAALHTAYAALGIGPGDEVITPPITFVATQAAAIHLGATVVFADVRPDTATIDPAAVEAAITPRTKAIVAVDYAGHPADMDELRAIADRHGLYLVEDAAHSIGSTYKDRPVGSLADVTTLSFFPTKNITTGEGGAVVVADSDILDRARRFSHQGLVRDRNRMAMPDEGPWHQEVPEFGLNYRLPDILAALGSSQLTRLQQYKQRRAEIKAAYDAAFAGIDGLTTPHQDDHVDPMWHLYPLRVPAQKRRQLVEGLRANGIIVQVNYMPAYWHPAFSPADFPRGLCSVAEDYYRGEISLPMHAGMADEDLTMITTALLGLVQHYEL